MAVNQFSELFLRDAERFSLPPDDSPQAELMAPVVLRRFHACKNIIYVHDDLHTIYV
jgi:hypothetical protein